MHSVECVEEGVATWPISFAVEAAGSEVGRHLSFASSYLGVQARKQLFRDSCAAVSQQVLAGGCL